MNTIRSETNQTRTQILETKIQIGFVTDFNVSDKFLRKLLFQAKIKNHLIFNSFIDYDSYILPLFYDDQMISV